MLRLDAIGTEDLGGPQDGGEMKVQSDKSLEDSWRVYVDGSEGSICERGSVV